MDNGRGVVGQVQHRRDAGGEWPMVRLGNFGVSKGFQRQVPHTRLLFARKAAKLSTAAGEASTTSGLASAVAELRISKPSPDCVRRLSDMAGVGVPSLNLTI